MRFGLPAYTADINGVPSSAQYDTFGRPTQVLGTDGTGTSYGYAYCPTLPASPLTPSPAPAWPPTGFLTSAACPTNGAFAVMATSQDSTGATIGRPTTSYYDTLGRVLQVDTIAFDGSSPPPSTPILSRVTTQYNAIGETVQVSKPYLVGAATQYATTSQYDPLGRVSKTISPDGLETDDTYHGLVQSATRVILTNQGQSGNTETVTTTRNALGEVASVQDPLGNVTTYAYFPFGNLASVTDAAGNIVSYQYDPLGRRTQVSDPDAGVRSFTYYSTGELATVLQPDPVTGAPVQTVSYDPYDGLGRPTKRTEPDLISSWSYDTGSNALGKLTGDSAEPNPANTAGTAAYAGVGFNRAYSYDSYGRPYQAALFFGRNDAITFTDAYVPLGQGGAGRLFSVTDGASRSIAQYAYTSLGYFQTLSRSSTTTSPNSTPVFGIQSEDAAGRPLTTTLGSAAFSNALATGSVTDNYQYDAGNQLLNAGNGVTSKSFGYDNQTGNLTSKSDTADRMTYPTAGSPRPHQLQELQDAAGSVIASYTYDTRGNLLTGEDGGQYTWTSFNQPSTITKDGATVQYFYDTDHRRIAAVTNIGGNTTTKLYLRDVSGAFAEAQLTGAPSVTNAIASVTDYFSAGGRLVGMLQSATALQTNGSIPTNMYYLHTDRAGSITGISDDTGALLEADSYDPWGRNRMTSGADAASGVPITSASNYGYIGEEKIAAVTSLLNLNARLYDARIGRFISADPIGLGGGRNVYAYAGNNPTTSSDPGGLAANDIQPNGGELPPEPIDVHGYSGFGDPNEAKIASGYGINISGPSDRGGSGTLRAERVVSTGTQGPRQDLLKTTR